MSADASYNILQSHADGHVVLPQPVGDLSLIDSVTGFIQEAYVNVLPAETKIGDRILWAKFVPCEPGPEVDSAPLILVLAYSTGVQAWSINSSGEAKEVLSWHQGIVKAFQFLPSPTPALTQCAGRDLYLLKRPLVALCDNGGPSPPFHNVTFLSLSTGEQVKHIKFKNEVCEILANKKCIIVTFSEKIAIFDACTLEDKFTITTCYPSPGIKCNPVSLGSRWLAFAERRLLSLSRSRGGYEGEGSVSYTATVLQAAKSLGKGLRELSGTVAHSLGGVGHGGMAVETGGDALCPGLVTVLDIECKSGESKKEGSIVAHFVAHLTPLVALSFDPTGLLLLTAEKRGHKFNVFRIEPCKSGSSHAYVHHLYILHRGDTTARVQDITFSSDSRWVAVSSLRGTTHVFPITMYGGSIGLRTHTTPHVVNRLSRFHKSAGIASVVTPSPPHPKSPPLSGSPDLSTSPSSSPLTSILSPTSPLVLVPLAQIRRQLSNSTVVNSGGLGHRQSSIDETTISVKVAACFASPKCSNVHAMRDNHLTMNKAARKSPAPSIFLITGHGYLIQYDLEPRPIAGLTKDKLCDDTPIDLLVEPRCQWRLFYPPIADKMSRVHSDLTLSLIPRQLTPSKEHHDKWLSQVEIITHAGPHRRLWMGPQFSFKTYTPPTSGEFSFDNIVTSNVNTMPTRSTPMNIEKSKNVPVLIETVSTGSSDQSPRFMEDLEGWAGNIRGGSTHLMGESQLCEDLADAMQETANSQGSGQQGVSGSNRVVWVTEKIKTDQKSGPKPDQKVPQCPDQGYPKSEPTNPDPSEKIVQALCESSGVRRAPLEIFVRKQTSNEVVKNVDKRKARDSKEPKQEERIEDKIGERNEERDVKEESITIVEDLFSMEDENGAKRNRKAKKMKENREEREAKETEENVKERKTSREEREAKRKREEKSRRDSREEMKRFEEFIDLNENAKPVEPTPENCVTNNSGSVENKKKSRRSKKNKELEAEVVEVEADIVDEIVDKIEDVDESLFAENIDIEEEREDKRVEISVKERKRSEEETALSADTNRYESIEHETRYENVSENRYGAIETDDRYEEIIDQDPYDEPYQYEEEEYDPYDEDLAEEIGHVYIQGEKESHVYLQGEIEGPVEPSLISDFPDIQSFERPRTPVTGLGDGSIIDSGCGLKKRKNKKKKR